MNATVNTEDLIKLLNENHSDVVKAAEENEKKILAELAGMKSQMLEIEQKQSRRARPRKQKPRKYPAHRDRNPKQPPRRKRPSLFIRSSRNFLERLRNMTSRSKSGLTTCASGSRKRPARVFALNSS